ncbi:hypothetical protein BCR33DRAFT_852316 [Rhizoclosmatium globosum]|uniref:Elongator complex protein 5 n=1 Tax=Rhizoclosmatium globosum TaxID=329046 RepID=A0A1Y2C2Q5_9FUNG|nr:hypothetical protein BCR33DRAFT_852316 [Rhizoclosmatium globosum]|eukprot:ORY41318.1 hypothetical protein BCR33DRAFT_852316 [Rhizoclosmatium globosum]
MATTSASLTSLASNLPPLSSPPASTRILITDDIRADGFPVLHNYLAAAQFNNKSTAAATTTLVSFSHPQSHYEAVARKLGYTLKATFVDGVRLLVDDDTPSVSKLMEHIKKSAVSGCMLVLDNIGLLLGLGVPVDAVVLFLVDVRKVVDSMGGNLVVLVHADVQDRDHEYLVSYIQEFVDFEIHVRGLDSGYTDRATGQNPV